MKASVVPYLCIFSMSLLVFSFYLLVPPMYWILFSLIFALRHANNSVKDYVKRQSLRKEAAYWYMISFNQILNLFPTEDYVLKFLECPTILALLHLSVIRSQRNPDEIIWTQAD